MQRTDTDPCWPWVCCFSFWVFIYTLLNYFKGPHSLHSLWLLQSFCLIRKSSNDIILFFMTERNFFIQQSIVGHLGSIFYSTAMNIHGCLSLRFWLRVLWVYTQDCYCWISSSFSFSCLGSPYIDIQGDFTSLHFHQWYIMISHPFCRYQHVFSWW